MSTLIRRGVFLLALAIILAAGSAAFGDNAARQREQKYREALQAIQQGNYRAATKLLDEVLALDPSSTEALELRNITETELMVEVLTRGPEELRRNMLEITRLAARAERERLTDEQQIRQHIEDLLAGFEVRHHAYGRLVGAGRHAVPLLIERLLDEEHPDYGEYRVRCTIALMRIGEEAVVPLSTALRSDSANLRQDIVFALGEIRDPRAVPYLLRAAQDDPSAQVREVAREALTKTGEEVSVQEVPAHEALFQHARLYYYDHPSVRRAAPDGHVTWAWSPDEQRLIMRPVPDFLHAVSMARNVATDALLANPDYEPTLPLLISAYRHEILLIDHALAGQDEAELPEPVIRQLHARREAAEHVMLSLRSAGEKHFYRALRLHVHDGNPARAAAVIDDLAVVARPELNEYTRLEPLYEPLRPAVYGTEGARRTDDSGRREEAQAARPAPTRPTADGDRTPGALLDAQRLFARQVEAERVATQPADLTESTLRDLIRAAERKVAVRETREDRDAQAERERRRRPRLDDNPLIRALREPQKPVRYGAAAALAQIEPNRPFAASSTVVDVLGQAITEKEVSTVLIIASDNQTANRLRQISRAAGHIGFSATNRADALAQAHELPPKDIFVIDERMEETYESIRNRPELARIPVVLVTRDDPAPAQRQYGDQVSAVVSLLDEPETIQARMGEAIAERQVRHLGYAVRPYAKLAAEALLRIPKADSPLSPHLDRIVAPLQEAMTSEHLEVRVAAIRMLGRAGATNLIPDLVTLYLRPETSPEERRACIAAIGDALEPGEPVPPSVQDLLVAVHRTGTQEMRELLVAKLERAAISPEELARLIVEQEAGGPRPPGDTD